MMEWIVTANKTIDNYNTIKKIIKPKASEEEEKKKEPVAAETKTPAIVANTKAPAIVAKKAPVVNGTKTISPAAKKPNKTSSK